MKKDRKGYYTKTFTHDGRRIYVKAKTRSELLNKVVKRKQQLEQQHDSIYNPTLRQYYEHFTELRRNEIKESTLRSQQSLVKMLLEFRDVDGAKFGDRKIREITRRDVERIRGELHKQGRTAPTLNNVFAHLSHVMKRALMDETIDKNPCKSLKPLKRENQPIRETKHRALTVKETKRFFSAARKSKSEYYNDFLFLIKSGIRIGELGALTSSDIDKKQGFIHITKTIYRNEIGGYSIGETTKTKSGSRDIPLTDELLKVVRDQERFNRRRIVENMGSDELPDNSDSAEIKKDLLFCNREGGILKEQSINREIKKLCVDAGIEPFTCHAFRNTFATRWIEQRPNSYKVLSEILGHKDISITLNLYTHVMQEQKISEMEKIKINVM